MPRIRIDTTVASSPRSKASSWLATRHPSWTSPTTFSFAVRTSVKKTSLNSWVWAMLTMGRMSMPGWSMGASRNVIPLCLICSGAVRHRMKIQLAVWASEVQIFWPLITHSSPSSTARVPSEARSEPELGSE